MLRWDGDAKCTAQFSNDRAKLKRPASANDHDFIF